FAFEVEQALRIDLAHAPHLFDVGDHREQDPNRRTVGGAQHGADLLAEKVRRLERQADRAQAEKRIALAELRAEQRMLVGTEIERADRQRPPFHALEHAAVEIPLLVLVRKIAPRKKRELGAVEAHAFGAVLVDQVDLADQPDVGQQAHAMAVEGFGGKLAQVLEAALELAVFDVEPAVFGQHVRSRTQVDGTRVAVDDDVGAFANRVQNAVDSDDGRDPERLCQDHRVRRHTARRRDDAAQLVVVDAGQVGHRKLVRNQHRIVTNLRHLGFDAEQEPQDSLAGLAHVGRTLAKVVVGHRLEALDVVVYDRLERAFGRDALVDLSADFGHELAHANARLFDFADRVGERRLETRALLEDADAGGDLDVGKIR